MPATTPVASVDIDAVRAALERVGDRFCTMVAGAPDASQPIPGSDWTVGDVAAHIALGIEAYARYGAGSDEPFVDVSDIAGGSLTRTSAGRLQDEPERDPGALVARIRAGLASLLESTTGRAADDLVIWHGVSMPLGGMLGIGLAEFLLHGRDVADALGHPWAIAPDDARLVLTAALPILPLLVDPDSTRGVHARYDLRVRGGTSVSVAIDDGRITVDGPGQPADCHVSADPVELLLVAYGRKAQWGPVMTGKLVAWGRKPWLGPKLVSYLVTP